MRRDIAALIAFLDARHATPHKWGRKANDCVGFCFAAAEAQTGKRPARGVNWTGQTSGLRVIKRFGSIEALLDSCFERIPPALAKRGDIGGVPDPDFGIHPMIVEGDTLVSPGERGNQRARRSAMICAWSIERPRE